MTQKPDNKPGAYYVTAVDGPRRWLLSGPYINDHAGALQDVDTVREIAVAGNPRAHFYAFGTARLDTAVGVGSAQEVGAMPIPRSAIAAGWHNGGAR